MANKINFITGETYTLSELFSGERRIIIPDLQRDYCWGNEDNTKSTGEKGELVTDFVNNLLEQFNEQRSTNDKGILNLGLFYGYEVPADHIQLCDGQQRLTTLFLLLGMINKQTDKFRQHLISDFEYKHDDKEPYLNYAIRESSLYFLSDLVCKFFIKNKDTVDKIKSADWYFDDYNLDPSIQSMLKALDKIEKIISEKDPDLSEFGDWLLNKVTFLYFDMENRKNGEETFVVINTTGEALSSTQNLKPLMLHEKNGEFDNTAFKSGENSVDQCWEEIETWFWQKRMDQNDTADAGFAEFLRWISIIEQVDKAVPEKEKTNSITKLIQLILQGKKCDFPYKEIAFEKIYNYWKALKWIAEKSGLTFVQDFLSPATKKDVNNRNAIGQNDCFVLLPVLKYAFKNIIEIESSTSTQRNAKRIYEFFSNLIRIDNVSKAVNTLVGDAIKIIDLLIDGDLVSLIDSKVDTAYISKQILTKEEIKKLEILSSPNLPNRDEVEETFWEAQKHNIWNGEILPIIEWAIEDGIFNFIKFKEYSDKFTEVFSDHCDSNIDIVRRALLTRDLNSYPRIFKGYTNWSFGWEWSDWHILINGNKEKFKSFFDDLLGGTDLEAMIKDYNDEKNVFYRFVKYPELLQYCEQKNIQKWDNSYRLIKQQRAIENNFVELETFCLYHKSISQLTHLSKDWKIWLWGKDSSAIVFDKDKDLDGLNVAMDVHYNRVKSDDWDVQLFLRGNSGENAEMELKDVADACKLDWNGARYEIKDLSKESAIEKIRELMEYINKHEGTKPEIILSEENPAV